MTQINVKFSPTVKIPEGFAEGAVYPVLAIDRIEERDEKGEFSLVTEFLLADRDGKFHWIKAESLVQSQAQEFKPNQNQQNFARHNGYGRQPVQQVRRAY